jgi:hypothetical protein
MALVTLALLCPLGVWAQEADQPPPQDQPTPATPSPPPPVSSLEPVTTRPLSPSVPRWAGSLEVRGGWDSNPLFLTPTETGSLLGGVNASVTRAERFRRGSVFLQASGALLGYKDVSQLNQATYSGQTGLNVQTSSTTSFGLDGSAGRSYTRELQDLQLDVASFLPQVVVDRYVAGATLAQKLSAHSSLSARVAYETYSFHSAFLESGTTLGASTSFSHQLSKDESLGLTYAFQRIGFSTQAAQAIHSVSLSWNATLARAFSASASVGATAVPGLGPATLVRPLFGAGLAWRPQHGVLEAHFARTSGESYGYGRVRYSDYLTLSVSRILGRLTVFTAGSLAYDHDPTDPAFHNQNVNLGGGLRFGVTRAVSVNTLVSWRRWAPSTLPQPVSGTYAVLSLSCRL